MDIFTILVFFLLVNSSDVEVLSSDKSIELPASIADTVPDTAVVVKVNNRQILVGGRAIVAIKDIPSEPLEDNNTIAALTTELEYLARNARPLSPEQEKTGRAITIMADKAIPYHLLKRIMNSCAVSGYRDISLAVNKPPEPDTAQSAGADS